MNILIMGAAGTGKGTMSAKIVDKYHIPHISTGDMFRAAIAEKSALGLQAQTYIDSGLLVPDDLVIMMVKERLLKYDCRDGYLLDGYPRTLNQAMAFKDIVNQINRPIQVVFNLLVNYDALAERVTGRRLCKQCGAIYHIHNSPSKVEGVCDVCSGPLIHRTDDTEEQLKIRLNEHAKLTEPVLKYYQKENLVIDIDATQDVEDVWQQIDKALENVQ